MRNRLPEEINGWKIYAHPCFQTAYNDLVADVESLRQKDPEGYQKKAAAKLLSVVHKVIEGIATDPISPNYRQGNTLGSGNKDWSRAKFGKGRYRLFFRFSTKEKVIILAWMNDEDTLRTYGSKNDAYAVFTKMLKEGHPPGSWGNLMIEVQKATKDEKEE